MTVRFASGALAQVHLDYLRRAYRRDLEVIGAEGVITWDYASRAVTVHGPEPDRGRDVSTRRTTGRTKTCTSTSCGTSSRCVEGREEPSVDGWEALRSLRLVEAAKRSAAERRWVSL